MKLTTLKGKSNTLKSLFYIIYKFMKTFIVVDIEADGQVPGLFSMVSFAAVPIVDGKIQENNTFYRTLKPISEDWDPESLSISGLTREDCVKNGSDPEKVMKEFARWVEKFKKDGKVKFISDNNGFDWSFINYYFHKFVGDNPFGHSSRRIGDIYSGFCKDLDAKYTHLVKTKHTHHPLDDAMGDAEAFVEILKLM